MKYILIALLTVSINCSMDENKGISQKKWISNGNESSSPWNRIIWPEILNFKNNLVAFNYSNDFMNYQIVDDYIVFNDDRKFRIVSYKEEEIVFEHKNKFHRYIPIKKGLFNNNHISEFIKILQTNKWCFNVEKNEFEYIKFGDGTISHYNENDSFIKGGVYFVILYNQNLILVQNVDGNYKKERYFVNKFSENEIAFSKLEKNDSLTPIILSIKQ